MSKSRSSCPSCSQIYKYDIKVCDALPHSRMLQPFRGGWSHIYTSTFTGRAMARLDRPLLPCISSLDAFGRLSGRGGVPFSTSYNSVFSQSACICQLLLVIFQSDSEDKQWVAWRTIICLVTLLFKLCRTAQSTHKSHGRHTSLNR